MNRKGILLAVVAFGTAVWALGQTYSNAPTDKDYRLAILEPTDGATIVGTDLTIVLSQPALPRGQSVNERERKNVMTPTFQVWVDGKDYGNLPIGQNVFTTHDLTYGPHKITVAAKNTAGELVERKEIGITTVASGSVQTRQTEQVQPAVAPPPAPAPEPVKAPPPAPPAPSAPEPASLPQTGTSYPAAAVAGFGLLIAGLILQRRRS